MMRPRCGSLNFAVPSTSRCSQLRSSIKTIPGTIEDSRRVFSSMKAPIFRLSVFAAMGSWRAVEPLRKVMWSS